MDEHPGEPRRRARERDPAQLSHGATPSDRRHDPPIEVLEWDARPTGERALDVGGDRASHLDRDRADTRQRRLRAGRDQSRHVADDEQLGVAGQRAVVRDGDPTSFVRRDAQARPERARTDARRPEHRRRGDGLGAEMDAVRVDTGYLDAGADLDAQLAQLLRRARRQALRERGQQARRAFDHHHPGLRGIKVMKIAREDVARQIRDRARELDAGRSATDDREGQPCPPRRRIALALGRLEREQHPPPDLGRVVQILEAGRQAPPIVVAVVIGVRARGHDQVVVPGALAVAQHQRAAGDVDVDDLGQHHVDVVLAPQDRSDRHGDLVVAEARHRHLVQQRLEQVIVQPVVDRDVDRDPRQAARGRQPPEAGAHDGNPRPRSGASNSSVGVGGAHATAGGPSRGRTTSKRVPTPEACASACTSPP